MRHIHGEYRKDLDAETVAFGGTAQVRNCLFYNNARTTKRELIHAMEG